MSDPTPPSQNQPADEPHADEPHTDGTNRERSDCFAPPEVPCECYCLHCQRVFMSDGIWFQKVINARDGFDGFWMCPTPNCGGAGFTFDIFPTDPHHPANEGWTEFDDEDDQETDDGEGEPGEYDPAEPKYAELDEELQGEEDDDLEGEEWKHGLQPGERPPEPPWVQEARKEWEKEQAKYDAPDERPRVLDWSNHPEPPESPIKDEDIPF
jgi:hypothetical protein